MEKGAVAQRKLSRGKSMQSTRGLFSRKTIKKADSQILTQTLSSSTVVGDDRASIATSKGKELERHSLEDNHVPPRPIFAVRSIIPDPLNELPAWYTQAAEGGPITVPQFRSKYPMHNPIGPRWYKNWHLHPSFLTNRPPSFFSPSFPPMASGADRSKESKVPGPSRTPSGSPLPTPTSSQTRIHDVRARPRKLSQTAHDNVDMLDGTDPWGTNWHHRSPYDLGGDRASPEPASESPVAQAQRNRRMSLTTGSRHKSTIPSPLSQSTSAVNLSPELLPVHITRRVSKSRKPFHDLFGGSHDNGNASKRISEPPPVLVNPPERPLKRGSSTGPSLASSAEKKEKRGSILGRLAKRFSVMRKPDQNRSSAKVGSIDNRSIMNGRPSIDTLPAAPSRSTPSPQKPSLHHAKSSDVSHRIQPPVLLDEPPTPLSATLPKDNTSLSSFEEPYPIGKLTIANPDEPAPPTPAEDIVPLPPLPPPETGVVADSGTWTEHLNGVLGIPISSSPSQMELPDTPLQHRLSTILSEDAPGTSPSPPLPELPPVTPSIVARVITEPSLPPTPEGTRPPTPEPRPVSYTPATPKSRPMSHTPATPESRPISRTPASPAMSNGTQARNALSYAMSPSSLSVFHSSLPSIDDLPLSRASLVVEPPTPHAPVLLIPAQAHASPMPSPEQVLQSNGDSPTQRDPSPSKRDSGRVKGSSSSTKSRRTETFKLIRSSSGNVHTVGESIMVEGEHWEVVADEKKSRKERSKSSEGEATPSKKEKESKKAERIASDDASDKKMRDRHRKSVNDKPNSDHAGRSSTYSEDTVRQSTSERRRSTTKERNRDSNGDVVRSTQTPVTPPMPSKSTSTRRERRTSSSTTRPSSEFQSAADINALKAKEAWDLERMWKGRSMVYGPDGTTVISNRPTIGSDSRPSTIMSHDLHRATSIPSVGDLQRASTMPASHGSSHTYFMVQTPTNGASSYEQIPVPVQPTKSTTTRNDYTLYRSFPDSVPFPTNSQAGALPNPLPDPPRLSVYTAAPLPPSLVGSGDGPSSSEYWTKYAGVSTTNH